MARKKAAETAKKAIAAADWGEPNSEPQWKFFTATEKYICYGGARGGGKSWAIIRKAALLAYNYPGIQILIIRREYDQLENPIIQPMLKLLPAGTYQYNKTEHLLTVFTGEEESTIKFSNMPDYEATVTGKFQGWNIDVLMIDEATQILESEFRGLAAIVRGNNGLPKRIYLSCNPGGIGHFWVKRLFVDREFRGKENPKDYIFIPATVEDNKDINQDYIDQLDLMPEDIRRAHRFGDWNALAGVFFGEFTDGIHTCKPFPIPAHWKKYRAMDYGLDMFFCIWVAVDENGRCYVYREFYQSNMRVSEAAKQQLLITRPDEQIYYTIAPPDMWSRNNDTGKTRAMTFMENGVPLIRADNNRIAGWSALKEMFKLGDDKKPNLIMFDTCGKLIECIKCLQHDKTNTDDVAKDPHEITHGPDALRYFAQTYVLPAEIQVEEEEEEDEGGVMDYFTAMCGTSVSRSYILS